MSQAAQMRRLFEAAAAPPAQTSGGYMSPAQRARATLLQQSPPQPMKPPDRRPTDQLSGFGLNRDQGRNRSGPQFGRRDGYNDILSRSTPPAANRYKVNMDARPQVSTPAFTSAQLKKPVELPPRPIQIKLENQAPLPVSKPSPPRPRREMDPSELDKLLQAAESTNRFQSLAKDRNVKPRCWHCGSTGHASLACPTKPTLREPQPTVQLPVGPKVMYQPVRPQQSAMPQTQRARESIADAADAWTRRTRGNLEIQPPSQRLDTENERRRSRFESNGPMEADRYEEPQRRKGRVVPRRREQDEEDDEDRRPRVSKQERKRLKAEARKAALQAKDEPTPITLPEFISVANLASILRLRVEDFVQKLEELGFEDVQNDHILNAEHAGLIAQEYNFEPNFQIEGQDGDLYPAPAVEQEVYAELPVRPPVVTIMGHVDHGKTTILDYMRSTSVAATEFGGITQHIGAFSVPLANGKKITFLDTPGHAAFETMRARGANVTDIVVLVVAADDSVMPQTVEAIKHAQAAKVPIIVAINKIDKQQADPEAVKLDLGRHGIEIEDFGGDVQAICVSGKTGQGIPDLEEAISTLSEMLDHRADPKATVEGWVLEGTTKKSGKVATVLVRSGTLRQGTTLVAGTTWTKVRGLRNEAGVAVKEVGPGVAVEVDGWRDQPIAGDEVLQADDEQHATAVSELRVEKEEREQMARDMDAVNEARRLEAERRRIEEAAAEAEANGEEVPVELKKAAGPELVSFIVKGDVSGSVEAVIDSISVLGNGDISTRVLRHGVGPPSEFDVTHAADAQGHIINFNTVVRAL